MTRETIVVLDFGGQYTHLISRRVRELGVYSEILTYDIPLEELEKIPDIKGIIFSGGPNSVYEEDSPLVSKEFFSWCRKRGVPILGICYGHQLIPYVLGGRVERLDTREYGKTVLYVENKEDIFQGLDDTETVWMSHGDQALELPPGFEKIGHTDNCPIAAYRNVKDKTYGVQFHIEVRHTEKGNKILENFVKGICGCKTTWGMEDWLEETIKNIKESIGGAKVIMAVSGGVDSTVAAILLQKAVGKNLHCVFVDNGLLRKNEAEEVISGFKRLNLKHIHSVDARETFLKGLEGVTDPEEKRRIIADTFIRIFERKARELENTYGKIEYLGQGTIYPDRVESAATGKATVKIKSHHNVTLPDGMTFKLVEPLASLYKDEVRKVGKMLGLSDDVIWRQPFPGPSLAVRIIGEVTEEKLNVLREADAIIQEEIQESDFRNRLWQSFAVLLPVKTVGVMGDARTYENVVAVRAVESEDAMTASFAKLDWNILERIASRMVNEVKGINRVVYDITNKPPSTVEWE
ncbi:MAG: glutamine-hydrolyzing GMP synthase [Candidatus Lokiarchaeia archaeon]